MAGPFTLTDTPRRFNIFLESQFTHPVTFWTKGWVHQTVSPISNSRIYDFLTNIWYDFFSTGKQRKKNLFWTNKKFFLFLKTAQTDINSWNKLVEASDEFVKSHVVMMFQSGAGVEVLENKHYMACRVYLPWEFINQTRGQL